MSDAPQSGQPAGSAEAVYDPMPARMLNEYAYCPRLFHLMHVDGRWESNVFTEEGKAAHARTDAADDTLPDPAAPAPAGGEGEGDPPPTISRSVMLSDTALGLIAKLDLVETESNTAVPVDFKRGKPPDNPFGCYEPGRVQLMGQGLLLRANGYSCSRGFLYFAAARKRVEVPFTPELEARTLDLLREAKLAVSRMEPPAPLDDSPKCNGCSLAGICLPDETNFLNARSSAGPGDLRRLYPARDDALPLYVQEQGARVGKSAKNLTVTMGREELTRFRLMDVSQIVLCGNIGITPQALHQAAEHGIPVVHLSRGHWFYCLTHGHGLRNAYDRAAQFAAAADDGRRLAFAKAVVEAKGRNQRTLLRRNASGADVDSALERMSRLLTRIAEATDTDSLLGLEGSLAAEYFAVWSAMIKDQALAQGFAFKERNRRPPRDPINAMLSFGYAMLAKDCTVALMAEGLDPWWGLYHRPRHGRPALALDVMEEFRPLVVDSAVLSAINNSMVAENDFETTRSGCAMKPKARRSFIQAYEARLDQLITHPIFDYRCSWRSVIRIQARLLTKWLRKDVPQYQGITTR